MDFLLSLIYIFIAVFPLLLIPITLLFASSEIPCRSSKQKGRQNYWLIAYIYVPRLLSHLCQRNKVASSHGDCMPVLTIKLKLFLR